MKRLSIAALLCCACSAAPQQPPSPPATWKTTSGTRLRARFEQAGSARRLVGWHDLTLGLDCSFTDATDAGLHRCLPPSAAFAAGYSDAGCSQALVAAPAGGAAAFLLGRAPACGTNTQVRSVVPATSAYEVVDGACAAVSTAGRYTAGAEVPLTTFAGATETPDPTGGRIHQLWLVSGDGARAPWGGWDTDRKVAATAGGTTATGARWVPWRAAWHDEDVYADAQCKVAGASATADTPRCTADAALHWRTQAGSCEPVELEVFEIGAPSDNPYVWAYAHCNPITNDGRSFAMGPKVPWESLAAGAFESRGTAPVLVRYLTEGGAPIEATTLSSAGAEPDLFVDAASGQPCAPRRFADGLRCAPASSAPFSVVFSDAACTLPLALWQANAGCSNTIDTVVGADTDGRTKGLPWRVYSVGARLTPPYAYYTYDATTGRCLQETVGAVDGLYHYEAHRLGDTLPADGFALVTSLTE